jgi:RNA polymerase sigma-70 factor (ECF subfamily)
MAIRGVAPYAALVPEPFLTTRWSLVARAGDWKPGSGDGAARAALEELVRAYWPPLYAFARARGAAGEDAADLVQGFFARALEKGGLVPRERSARFRAFLLASFQHFCANEHERATAQKRGGGRLEELGEHSADEDARRVPADSPERAFERRFAQRVLERTLASLQAEQERAGKGALFARLRPHLTGDDAAAPYEALARELGGTPGALKVAVHRLRRRYGELLREEVGGTLVDPAEIDAELAALRLALGS